MSENGLSCIRIKFGAVEIDFEGSETFLKAELSNVLEAVTKLSKELGPVVKIPTSSMSPSSGGGGTVQGTTGQLAAKLGCKSGTDLIIAGAARLTFVTGKDVFSRKELTEEIKSASGYYKSTYSGNLTGYLNGLVKDGKLLEPSKDNYSLSATAKATLLAAISDS